MRIAIVGNFGLTYKATMSHRAMPIAAELARRGHRVGVFVPAASPEPPVPDADPMLTIHEVRPSKLLAGRRSAAVGPLGHAWTGVAMVWNVIRFRPSVLYGFKPKGYAGLALLVFWILRQSHLVDATLALDTDDWEGAGGWADREAGPSWRGKLITWHERWCLRHADVVTVASRALIELAAPHRAGVLYAPNAASPTSPGWRPAPRDQSRRELDLGDRPTVLAYTRFVEFEPSRLLATFEAIRARVPDAALVVAGQGLAGEEVALAKLATERGVRDSVRLLGWTQPRDLPRVFAGADVALYPLDDSLLNRAKCPMKLVDLLLAGVPVVADDVGQASEYIVDGKTGYLARPDDPSAMAALAADLLVDPVRRAQIGHSARADVLERWSWSRQVDAIEKALSDYAGRVSRISAK